MRLIFSIIVFGLALQSPGMIHAAESNDCGSSNPLLGYGPGPFGGAWAGQHRDGRNSDWADCEIGRNGYVFSRFVFAEDPHTTFSQPVVAPDNTSWLVVSLTGRGAGIEPDSTLLYRADTSTGTVLTRLGPDDGLNRTVSWNAPVIDNQGNIYLGQELDRRRSVKCRFEGESLAAGRRCGEYFSFDPDGNLRWSIVTDGGTLGAQFTNDGNVVFQTWRGTIYVVDPDPAIPDDSRVLSATNSFPDAAATLPDFPDNDVVMNCLYEARNDKCISGNILAVSPQTGSIYNTVQGFVKGSPDSYLQRWFYDAATHSVTLDTNWNTEIPLLGGCPSSPDISFDGRTLFVHDLQSNIYALDAETGDILAESDIGDGYTPVGLSTTAPEFDAEGNLIGTYVTFQRAMELDAEPKPYVRIMRYRPMEGFVTTSLFDGSDALPAWIARRNPAGGLFRKDDISPKLRFVVIANLDCNGCPIDGKQFLLVINPHINRVLSATWLVGQFSGTFSIGSDKSVVISVKPKQYYQGSIDWPTSTLKRLRNLLEITAVGASEYSPKSLWSYSIKPHRLLVLCPRTIVY